MSKEYWREEYGEVIIVFIKKHDEIMAAAKYIKSGSRESGEIFVSEMYWKNIEARIMLFRYFAKHKEQFLSTVFRVPYGVNFAQWLGYTTRHFKASINSKAWIVRSVDVVEKL